MREKIVKILDVMPTYTGWLAILLVGAAIYLALHYQGEGAIIALILAVIVMFDDQEAV